MCPLKLRDFNFEVPDSQIAQFPLENRDESRLLCRLSDGVINHRNVSDLPLMIPSGSLVILNNTKVFASRLVGHFATGGKVEVFVSEIPVGEERAICRVLARPRKKLKTRGRVLFDQGIEAEVIGSRDVETLDLAFNCGAKQLLPWLLENAQIPLPPYIKRPDASNNGFDQQRYQTVYASVLGSVAAPTAGFHFTEVIIDRLKANGVEVQYVTLHVGLGTFMPVRTETIREHKMHAEPFTVPVQTIEAIQRKKSEGKKIIVVGTTSLRCLESLFRQAKHDYERALDLCDRWLSTDLFVFPETSDPCFKPEFADALMTNFHLPESTLFMLISALIGLASAKALYQEAVQKGYRFYSYGDTSLLWF